MKSLKYTLTLTIFLIFVVSSYSQTDKSAGSDSSMNDIITSSGEAFLSGKNLTEIPEFIYESKDLKYLDLSDNSITEISAKIGNLRDLRILDLTGNDIYILPDELSKLKFLRELHLDYDYWRNNLPQLKKLTRARIILH